MPKTEFIRDRTKIDIDLLSKGIAALPGALQKMGFTALRKGQDDIVSNVLGGRDTLGFLPTSQGKTATFVVPSICLGFRTLVFSPLIALMQDQVQGLWKKGLTAGQISSNASDAENRSALLRWVQGEIQFLYVAPERMKNEEFMKTIRQRRPDMMVVDEAHSISQWGTNFRPQYSKIGNLIEELDPRVVLAITATATKDVEEEIREVLHMQTAYKIAYLPRRENLNYSSSPHPGDYGLAQKIQDIGGSTIVYCATTKEVERVAASLDRHLPGRVTIYHGGLGKGEKRSNQDMFTQKEVDVCVATNAFGMGIDIADIRGVIHHDYPGSIEAYTQEAGRAGRDGKPSVCHIFERAETRSTQMFFVENGFPSERDIRTIYEVVRSKAAALNQDFVELTFENIAVEAGMSTYASQKVAAAVSIMVRNGVLDRPRSDDKIAKIRFKGAAFSDPRVDKYFQAVERFGTPEKGGFYEIDMDLLSSKVGVAEPTVRKNLKEWQLAQTLDFIPPFRGVPTYIKGDVNTINFADLKARYKEAVGRIDEVIKYIRTPDAQKAEFLRAYFDKA